MTEIAARLPRSRGLFRALQAFVLAVGLAAVVLGAVALRPKARAQVAQPRAIAPTQGVKRGAAARLANLRAARAEAQTSRSLGADAAHAFDRGFFVASPGGIVATAERVARWHGLVVRAARAGRVSAALLEAMVFVESAGRADVTSGSAAGLTQLQPRLARALHLRVKLDHSGRLTRRIAVARPVRARQLRRWRSRYDQRFAPAASLDATARYLRAARRTFGRLDLAIASYHLGIGNLRRIVASFDGESRPSYSQLYFGSSPSRHASAWRRLAVGGDYYWKVLAAERLMRMYRHGAASLVYEARLQARKNSAEEVFHPRAVTPQFGTPAAIAAAWRHHVLRAIPRDAARTHVAVSGFLGQEAHALGRSRRLYMGLRPAAVDVLLYIGKRVHALSGAKRLLVTSAVRDDRYQRLLTRVNPNATQAYSMHTTGYAFDIARSYSSVRQAAAFQFVLDRLTAVGAIAYIREFGAMHIAVAADARRKLALLARS